MSSRSDAPDAPDDDPRVRAAITRYWRRNVALMTVLLFVWAAAGLGGGVLFADSLAGVRLGGFPLGFWLAQQGSIVVFVVVILVYVLAMGRLDRAHARELADLGIGVDPDGPRA